jgi:uncharacterized membrane protein YbhN (UPF0104 family)
VVLIVLVVGGVHAALSSAHGATRRTSSRWLVLAPALVAEALSLLGPAVVCRQLVASQGHRLTRRSAMSISLASNSIAAFVPGGSVSASLWVTSRYRRRRIPTGVAMWCILSAGFASTVVLLVLLVVGAGVAGVADPVLVAVSGAALVIGSCVFVWLVHRASRPAVAGRFGPGLVGSLAARAVETGGRRAGWARGGVVLAASALNWLADAAVLAAAFVFFGGPVPWAGLLFAYCASQAAGAVIPLPGGLGAVEGGLLGALALVGDTSHNTLAVVAVYRLVGYWLPAAVGLPAWVLSRHHDRGTGLDVGGQLATDSETAHDDRGLAA